MERVNLKDDIFIDGFDSELSAVSTGASMWFGKNMELLLYAGRTSEIPEELAEEYACRIIENTIGADLPLEFKGNWYNHIDYCNHCKTAKQSIQSACPEEYCIIYKE